MTKRYQREVIRICIFKKKTKHWPKDTKGRLSESVYLKRTDNTLAKRYQREIIRICILKKNRQQNTMAKRYQREVIRIYILKKNRQHNGQKIQKGGYQNLYI